MNYYIFDTDHLSLYQRGHLGLKAQIDLLGLEDVATTVSTAEEQMRGRLAQIRAAKAEAEQLKAYRLLRETMEIIRDFQILDYDAAARTIYESFRQQKLRVGTADLRIAAIALSVNAIVVTRNARDFEQIQGLNIQTWTV